MLPTLASSAMWKRPRLPSNGLRAFYGTHPVQQPLQPGRLLLLLGNLSLKLCLALDQPVEGDAAGVDGGLQHLLHRLDGPVRWGSSRQERRGCR